MKSKLGLIGLVGLIGAVVLYLLAKGLYAVVTKALLAIAGVSATLIALLVVVVLCFAFRKPKQKPEEAAVQEGKKALAKGRTDLLEARKLSMRIRHEHIRPLSQKACGTGDRILSKLKEQPEGISQNRQFFEYYLPTLCLVLRKYLQLEESGVPAQSVTDTTVTCMENINSALEKQYANLFERDILDLSLEMEVLTQMFKKDGLLSGEELTMSEAGETITLSL